MLTPTSSTPYILHSRWPHSHYYPLNTICILILHNPPTLTQLLNTICTVEAFTAFIYSTLSVTTLVFVAELRVRKVEMLYTLFALVDAKKSYVRYISHEMRTPLNAATLGLNMLVTQLKKKNNPTVADEELCDSIKDIQLACSTAVDILNDLLSFEKLERWSSSPDSLPDHTLSAYPLTHSL